MSMKASDRIMGTIAALAFGLALFRPALASAEQISFPVASGSLTGELYRPQGPGPFPAVIALHGCSGLYKRGTTDLSARHRDWADRLTAAGYAVLFPDSFTARGFDQICTVHDRQITPKDRSDDAVAAANWLASQPFVDKSRIDLMGWSHGAMSVLWTVRPELRSQAAIFATAVAFYPGCRAIARLPEWQPTVGLTVLSGANDDWTEAGPCRDLAARTGFHFIEYPGAYHDFDAPGIPLHIRSGLSAVRGGQAHVGTNPEARQKAIAEVLSLFAKSAK